MKISFVFRKIAVSILRFHLRSSDFPSSFFSTSVYSISECIYNPTYTHPVKPRFLTLLRSREILANPVESITIMPGNLQSFQVQLSSALLSLSSREKWICCASSPKMISAKSLDKKENKMKKATGITVYGAHILCSVWSSIFCSITKEDRKKNILLVR